MTKWAVENKLGPNLVEFINNEFSINDDPYRSTKIKYVSAISGQTMILFSPLDSKKLKEFLSSCLLIWISSR